MAGELAHHGPDGTGMLLDGDFGMVNTRLLGQPHISRQLSVDAVVQTFQLTRL